MNHKGRKGAKLHEVFFEPQRKEGAKFHNGTDIEPQSAKRQKNVATNETNGH